MRTQLMRPSRAPEDWGRECCVTAALAIERVDAYVDARVDARLEREGTSGWTTCEDAIGPNAASAEGVGAGAGAAVGGAAGGAREVRVASLAAISATAAPATAATTASPAAAPGIA